MTIPVNVVATIHVPAARIADVSDGHRKLTDDLGVTAEVEVRIDPQLERRKLDLVQPLD